jgi:GAF domain-containing protein
MADSEVAAKVKQPIPPDEEERIKTLHALDLMDATFEPAFQRITSLCCQIFDVPIALVSLVDTDKQFFKSNRGLGDVRETHRDLAFCAHAIMPEAEDVFVVPDATADDRFRANGLVTDWPHIRFYAGARIGCVGEDGKEHFIGTLCIIDTCVERGGICGARDDFDDTKRVMLEELAAMTKDAIELRTFRRRDAPAAKKRKASP